MGHPIFRDARTTGVLLLGLLLTIAAPAHGQQRQSGWMADAANGCRVWNPFPEPDETIKWEGPCVNGFAHGRGTLRWYSAGKLLETDQGEFKDGRLNGFAVLTFTSGRKFEGNFVDQKPQGQGTLSEANGEVYSGLWSQGCFNDRGRQATFNTSKQACGFN